MLEGLTGLVRRGSSSTDRENYIVGDDLKPAAQAGPGPPDSDDLLGGRAVAPANMYELAGCASAARVRHTHTYIYIYRRLSITMICPISVTVCGVI